MRTAAPPAPASASAAAHSGAPRHPSTPPVTPDARPQSSRRAVCHAGCSRVQPSRHRAEHCRSGVPACEHNAYCAHRGPLAKHPSRQPSSASGCHAGSSLTPPAKQPPRQTPRVVCHGGCSPAVPRCAQYGIMLTHSPPHCQAAARCHDGCSRAHPSRQTARHADCLAASVAPGVAPGCRGAPPFPAADAHAVGGADVAAHPPTAGPGSASGRSPRQGRCQRSSSGARPTATGAALSRGGHGTGRRRGPSTGGSVTSPARLNPGKTPVESPQGGDPREQRRHSAPVAVPHRAPFVPHGTIAPRA